MTTLLEDFENSVKLYRERTALKYFDWNATYGHLDLFSNSVAKQLSEYLKLGGPVVLCTQNIPQFPIVEYACWKLGATVLPANPSYTARELSYTLHDSGAELVIVQSESEKMAREAAALAGNKARVIPTNSFTFATPPTKHAGKWGFKDGEEGLDLSLSGKNIQTKNNYLRKPSANDAALLVYTSGTTGEPKGAVLRHRNVHAGAQIYKDWFRYTTEDKILGMAPFFHVTGLVFHLAATILSGSSVIAAGRFDPVLALEEIQNEGTTMTMLAATAYLAMLNVQGIEKYDLTSMRVWSSGGMAVPRQLEEDWRSLTGDWLYVAWGMTETSSPATLWPYPYKGQLPVDPETGVVSSGMPVYDTHAKVVDEDGRSLPDGQAGELCVKGPQVIDSYLNKPDATSKSFIGSWLLTGDIAKIINGWVYIIDRKKDMINSSGFKVWPREVEEVLYSHPSVAEAAVVGVPDSYRGESVKAFVSLKPGLSQTDTLKSELIEYCRGRLAPYKVPRQVEFVEQIPKTLSGKLLRRALKEPLQSER